MINGSKAVITEFKGKTACFYLEDNRAVELFFEEESEFTTGDIYIGRVSNVRADLNAAFVDLKPGETGFLPLEKGFPVPKQGDEFPVMVTAEAQKNKPFSLSRVLNVHGVNAVAIPDDTEIRVSTKLSEADRDRLKTLAGGLSLKTGVIVRTAAASVPEEELSKEIVRLSDKLHEIFQTAGTRSAYSRVYEAKPSFYERIDELDPESVVTDDQTVYDRASKFIRNPEKVSLYKDTKMPLAILYGLGAKFSEATDKKVNLKTGGYLYIEPTEALTVIDVNSGKLDKKRSKEELIRITNLEAAEEIFRQIRLRNISGMIIVDFINFKSEDDEKELVAKIRAFAKADPTKTAFADITKLGLAEITRQKKYTSIYE